MFPGDRRTDGEHVEKLFVTGNHDVDGYHECGVSTAFLKDYPNCVAFSGHTHASLSRMRHVNARDLD